MDVPVFQEVVERFAGKWLKFEEITFSDPVHGNTKTWEYVRRVGGCPGRVDAVEVVSFLKQSNQPDHVVLVTQYRPPIKQYCIEFPAGLVEPSETVLDAAKREMKEECGYTIDDNVSLSPTLFYEPGLSNSNVQLVFAEINGDLEVNKNPPQTLENDEWSLRPLILPVNDLFAALKEYSAAHNMAIDAKLYTFAMGLSFSTQLQ